MYLNHFGLRELPFTITPDTSFFFAYGHYTDALNTLLVALRTGEGFIKVTGEVGTGKTLLCRKLLNTLRRGFVTAYIPNPMLSPVGLQMAVAEELGLDVDGEASPHRLQKLIGQRLVELIAAGQRVVLCVDEAQAMPLETLEAVRLLTNLETEKHKLLQVVLFGQPELDARLSEPSVRQLKQRIGFSYRLDAIDRRGLDAYLAHRLAVAGFAGGQLFAPAARAALYEASRGIPRLVNILAHKGMLAAYGRGSRVVDKGHIRAAIRDSRAAGGTPVRRRGRWPAVIATLLLAASLAVLAYVYGQHWGIR